MLLLNQLDEEFGLFVAEAVDVGAGVVVDDESNISYKSRAHVGFIKLWEWGRRGFFCCFFFERFFLLFFFFVQKVRRYLYSKAMCNKKD